MNSLLKNKLLWSTILISLILFSFINVNISVHAASAPKVSLNLTRLEFSQGYWNYRADYTLRNLYDGSIKVNGVIFVDHITNSSSTEVGYAIKPGKKYTFTFYSKSGGKGGVIVSKIIIGPKAPAPTSYSTPTPI